MEQLAFGPHVRASEAVVVPAATPIAPEPVAVRPRRTPGRLDITGVQAGSVIAILLVWEGVARLFHINPTVMPAPDMIIWSWWDNIANFDLLSNLAATLTIVGIGFGLSAIAGLATGLAMGLFDKFRFMADPYVTLLLTIPFTAVIPALVVILGIGSSLGIAAAGLFAFPLIVVNTYGGIRTVDRSIVDMATTFQITGVRMVRVVLLPAALPSIVVGLQQGLSSAIKGVILAEMLATYTGLGSMIVNFGGSFRSDHLLAVVFTILVIDLILDLILNRIRRKIASWENS